MRMLFLSPWCPYPADNGSKLRIYHLLRGLARRHAVDLISFCPEGDPDGSRARHLGGFCQAVELLPETPFARRRVGAVAGLLSARPRSLVADFSPAMAALARQAAGRGYSAVIACQLHMLPYALEMSGAPLILEELELAGLADPLRSGPTMLHRLRASLTWAKTAGYLRRSFARLSAITVASEQEQALARALAPGGLPVAVVPNGVDLSGGAAVHADPEPDTLIYPGAISYEANFDAVAHFIADILPLIRARRPGVRLLVTGRATPEQLAALPAADGVVFTGYLNDVRSAVAGAWAEVVPLRKGGGTRLKVLEALALGTPVISTSKGVEGLGLEPGRHALIADDPHAFAEQALRLLGSPKLRRSLADGGRQAVIRYDWRYSVDRLDTLLKNMSGVTALARS